MANDIKEYVLALRPWSLTAAVVPILVTTAVVKGSFLSFEFARCMVMGICVQAGANLTNTYFDYVNGVDNDKYQNCGEKTLVEKKVSTGGLLTLMVVLYIIAILAMLPALFGAGSSLLIGIFATGLLLAFFYTATPIGLKYHALGDITIFVCFGPLLMQCTAILLTGQMSSALNLFTLPIGLLTEAILHANNARDIKADSEAGAKTLAALIGFDNSFLVYVGLIASSYLSVVYIAIMRHWGCLAVFLTAPLGIGLIADFKKNDMQELPDKTAQTHLPFGILMLLGVVFTSSGVL